MKKLILLCFFLTLSTTFYAQESKSEKKESGKTRTGYDYNKDVNVKSTKKESEVKESKNKKSEAKKSEVKEFEKKESSKTRTGYDYNKNVSVKSKAVKKESKSEANKIDAKIKDEKYTNGNSKKKQIYRETNEKAPKVPDRVTGEYKGKKVYTGPRGGRYYINKNGNKTYIED